MPTKNTPPPDQTQQQKEFLSSALPELQKLYEDPAAWARLEPTEQRALIETLRSIPTPPSEQAGRATRGRSMIEFITGALGWAPTEVAKSYGYDLPITPDQAKILESVEKHKRTAVTSGHGTGKTKIASAAALGYLFRRPQRKVITTAATWTQVEKQLWSEIRAAVQKAPTKLPGRLLNTAIDIQADWFALGLSTDDYSKFSGQHAPNGVLVIIDEATGVREEIAQAADSLILGPDDRLLAIGNPTDPMSWFRAASESPIWNRIIMDCRNHPNVVHRDPYIIPGAVTYEWVQDQIETLGEDSPLFLAKVAGQWPDMKADALIQLGWVTKAQERDKEFPEDWKGAALAIDVAGPGGDLLVISLIKNRRWRILAWKQRHDYMAGVGLIVAFAVQHNVRLIILDDTGVGGAITSRLREVKRSVDSLLGDEVRIIPINFAAQATQKNSYNRLKDQLWWNAREMMKTGDITLPTDKELAALRLPREHNFVKQITSAIYRLDSAGRVDVYDRRDDHDDQTKLLPNTSPDLAHSWILACFGWKLLREDHRPAPPKDNIEAITQEFHATMQAKIKDFHEQLERGNRVREGRTDAAGAEDGLW